MIKYCLEHWDKNKDVLQKYLQTKDNDYINRLSYKDICRLVFVYILSGNEESGDIEFDVCNITEIDNGDYQGTLLFLIPFDTYQPSEYEYFMTYIGYGSCSVCDALQSLQFEDDKEVMIKELMLICKDIVANCIVPYNCGWRSDSKFDKVEWNE